MYTFDFKSLMDDLGVKSAAEAHRRYFVGSDNSEITNCEISFIGGRGVIMGAGNTVDVCNIHDINANGIDADNGTFEITNSTIEDIAQIIGAGYGWDGQ